MAAQFATTSILGDDPVAIQNGVSFSVLDVSMDSAAFTYITRRVKESLPDAEVVQVRRIWNRHIWPAYNLQRDIVAAQSPGGFANTKLLFHGAPTDVLEQLIGSSSHAGRNASGFDPNYSGECAYSARGCGCYFAEYAVYPVRIHPRAFDQRTRTYVVIAAEVICGNQHDMGSQTKAMRTAPPAVGGGLCDSVTGTEDGIGYKRVPGGTEELGKQHVVYRPDRAYPFFLVDIEPPAVVPLGVPIVLASLRSTNNIQNAGTNEDKSPAARAENRNMGSYEKLMIVRSPSDPVYFGILSLKYTPHMFLRVDANDSCYFDRDACLGDEQWTIEAEGYELFFVSRKNGKTLQCTDDGTVKTVNENREAHEAWKLSVPGSLGVPTINVQGSQPVLRPVLPPPPGLVLGRPIVLTSRRSTNNVQNAGTSEDKSPAARAENGNMGSRTRSSSHEKLMIVRSPSDPAYFGILSLKYTPHMFLRVDANDSCYFDRDACLGDEQWTIEAEGYELFFVSRKNGKTLQCTDDGTVKRR